MGIADATVATRRMTVVKVIGCIGEVFECLMVCRRRKEKRLLFSGFLDILVVDMILTDEARMGANEARVMYGQ